MKKINLLFLLTFYLLTLSCTSSSEDDNTVPPESNGSKLYAVMGTCNGNGSTANLVEINTSDGSTNIISNTNLYNSQGVTFNSNTSELYFSDFTTTPPSLLKLNINDGTSSIVNITYQNSFCHLDELFYNNINQTLYGVMGTCNGNGETAKLIKINTSDGSTQIVSNINLYNSQALTFNFSTSELYFTDFTTTPPSLLKLNINDGTSRIVNITYQSSFCHLDELFYNNINQTLYGVMATCNGDGDSAMLVKINTSDGSTSIVSNTNLYKSQSVTFNSNTSELYFSDFTTTPPNLLKVNINDGTSSTVNISYQSTFCHLDELYLIN